MRPVEPQVRLIARPQLDLNNIAAYLESIGGSNWLEKMDANQLHIDAQNLIEFAGRMCYRSWKPGLNPNVSKIREDQELYLLNILGSGHGSVLEHANFTFAFQDVSRVFTHELVRHRPGVAISQESLRYVRLTDIPFWLPEWALDDPELMDAAQDVLLTLEGFQNWMSRHFKLDDPETKMHDKKAMTSFMRRFAPEGVATSLVWTANIRTLRHVIEARTSMGAEEEIRLVFHKVGQIMKKEAPALFRDYHSNADGEWLPTWRKV